MRLGHPSTHVVNKEMSLHVTEQDDPKTSRLAGKSQTTYLGFYGKINTGEKIYAT